MGLSASRSALIRVNYRRRCSIHTAMLAHHPTVSQIHLCSNPNSRKNYMQKPANAALTAPLPPIILPNARVGRAFRNPLSGMFS